MKPAVTYCNFQPASEPGPDGRIVFRCANRGCTNAVRATESQLRDTRCKSNGGECIHLGAPTGETVTCKGCPGSPRVHELFECAVFGRCTPVVRRNKVTTPDVAKCDGCGSRG